jgi:hypothetical protein
MQERINQHITKGQWIEVIALVIQGYQEALEKYEREKERSGIRPHASRDKAQSSHAAHMSSPSQKQLRLKLLSFEEAESRLVDVLVQYISLSLRNQQQQQVLSASASPLSSSGSLNGSGYQPNTNIVPTPVIANGEKQGVESNNRSVPFSVSSKLIDRQWDLKGDEKLSSSPTKFRHSLNPLQAPHPKKPRSSSHNAIIERSSGITVGLTDNSLEVTTAALNEKKTHLEQFARVHNLPASSGSVTTTSSSTSASSPPTSPLTASRDASVGRRMKNGHVLDSEWERACHAIAIVAIDSCLVINRADILFEKIFPLFFQFSSSANRNKPKSFRKYIIENLEPFILGDKLAQEITPEIVTLIFDYYIHIKNFEKLEAIISHIPITKLNFHEVCSVRFFFVHHLFLGCAVLSQT